MKNLSIIFPVYNEKDTLQLVLEEWKKELDKHNLQYIFLICEDGSTDGTKELLKKLKKDYSLTLNQKKDRRGYGKAVLDGIAAANSEYILCVDSDGQCDPKDFIKFWKKKDRADIILGTRTHRADTSLRKIYSTFFKTAFIILYGNKIKDPSAPFVLFKKQTILPYINYLRYLQEGFWWGFSATIIKTNMTFQEIPINHRLRIKGNTQVYKLTKIPSIALRNIFSLISLRFS